MRQFVTVKGLSFQGNTAEMNKWQGLNMNNTVNPIVTGNTFRNNNFWDKDCEITTLAASITNTATTLTFTSGTNFAGLGLRSASLLTMSR